MSKEAMKLALEALKQIDEAMPFPVAKLAQAALREALAEQSAQQEPLTDDEIAKEVEAELKHYWKGEYIDTTGARDQLTAFARAIEAAHGIKGDA